MQTLWERFSGYERETIDAVLDGGGGGLRRGGRAAVRVAAPLLSLSSLRSCCHLHVTPRSLLSPLYFLVIISDEESVRIMPGNGAGIGIRYTNDHA